MRLVSTNFEEFELERLERKVEEIIRKHGFHPPVLPTFGSEWVHEINFLVGIEEENGTVFSKNVWIRFSTDENDPRYINITENSKVVKNLQEFIKDKFGIAEIEEINTYCIVKVQ